jgi:hypothetical protein
VSGDVINLTIIEQETVIRITITEENPITINFFNIAVPDSRVIENRVAAELAETNAEAAATQAQTYLSTVEASATAAASSATNAATSAATATTQASNASTSATAAAGSATTASTQATNASNSATAASTSATNASNSATAAATSETNAATSATNAANSATAAAASASSIGLTTKGDLLTRNASANTRLGVGANGKVLTANSSATEGIEWADPTVADNTISTAKIQDGAVNAAKILDGSITNAEINASAAIAMSKTNYAVAFLKESQASNSAGGTFTSGAWQTRTLNNESDPDGIVTLSSNQFTLSAGTYLIEAEAPAFLVDQHQAKLRNITDSTDDILGSAEFSASAANYAQTWSKVKGVITIAGSKTFEIQHRATTTRSTNGFGTSPNFSVNVIFTTVKITRIK